MRRDLEPLLNDLLVRWHRWSSAPARVADTFMQDFDGQLARLPAEHRAALANQARNLAGAVAVWSSVRAGDLTTARVALKNLLADDAGRWFGRRILYLNERGNRIGESNPRAELSDHEVDLLLQMREERDPEGKPLYSYGWLAAKFEVPKSTVSDICLGRRRCQAAVRTKVLDDTPAAKRMVLASEILEGVVENPMAPERRHKYSQPKPGAPRPSGPLVSFRELAVELSLSMPALAGYVRNVRPDLWPKPQVQAGSFSGGNASYFTREALAPWLAAFRDHQRAKPACTHGKRIKA